MEESAKAVIKEAKVIDSELAKFSPIAVVSAAKLDAVNETKFNQAVNMSASSDTNSQKEAIKMFVELKDPRAIEIMRNMITSRSPLASDIEVVKALGSFKEPQAADYLIIILLQTSYDSTIRAEAANSLGNIGDVRAVEALGSVISNSGEYSSVIKAASEALGRIGDPRAV